jgi:ATP-dependent DNA helicase PIF1
MPQVFLPLAACTEIGTVHKLRVQLYGDAAAGLFASKLLDVGNGAVSVNIEGQFMYEDFAEHVLTKEQLINNVYPQVTSNFRDCNWLCERAVMAPQNITVRAINQQLMRQLPGEEGSYKLLDTCGTRGSNSVPNGVSQQFRTNRYSTLKTGCPVMLLRNIDPPKLCNGTRLIIRQMNNNVIEATILTGQTKGQQVFLPRIPLIPSDCPMSFKPLQFPLHLSFAMTINKAQRQSLKVVGLNLEYPCFSHGQFYVGCSRVSSTHNIFIHSSEARTRNIVYPTALR